MKQVAQGIEPKTSSTDDHPSSLWQLGYPAIEAGLGRRVRGRIYFFGLRPQDVTVADGIVTGSRMTPLDKHPSWARPPHVALANLPTFDASGKNTMKAEPGLTLDIGAAKRFVREYGFLNIGSVDSSEIVSVSESLEDMAATQQNLRKAWRSENAIPPNGFYSMVHVRRHDEVSIVGTHLWNFIELLLALDQKGGKLGICANPDCPTPYFVKKRSTQIFCEAGDCVAYKQRKYALEYWNSKGKKLRARKQKATRGGKR
jgi:hypothetical protein